MANRLMLSIMALGMFVLAVGLFFPALIDAQDAELRDSTELDEGQSVTFDDLVKVTLNEVDPGDDSINVTVTDVGTLQTATIEQINVSETKTVAPAGDNVSVTNEHEVDGDTAIVSATFSRTYGWEEGAVTFLNNFDVMLILIGVLMMLGSVVTMVRI